MYKRLTISLDEDLYDRLHVVAGRRNISRFIESVVRRHLMPVELDVGYEAMARDESQEAEALEWCEALIGDAADETR